MKPDPSRRKLLRSATLALAAIPLVTVRSSAAATNPALRAQLQYQDTPSGDMICATCVDFVPGPTEAALGGCTRIPGDSEISPRGYCVAWNTM
jgi:hypothetical protein